MTSQEEKQKRKKLIKDTILSKFQDKEFTTGDVFYAIKEKWDKYFFGSVFSNLKAFTKSGFLSYRMDKRISGKQSHNLRYGAIYKIANPNL